jgi:hypothetical protein
MHKTKGRDSFRRIARKLDELVLVPCHAVYVGKEQDHILMDEYWIGGFPGEAELYAEHADAGVVETAKKKKALLIFSGGQTREKAGPISEAQSYYMLEEQKDWLGTDVAIRAITEEFARDSFENLLFSVCRFHQCTGKEPRHITVCSFGFKASRYKAHADALGISEKLFYQEVNNPAGDADDPNSPLAKALAGEQETSYLFAKYPTGDQGTLLAKKLKRDPFARGNPYVHEEIYQLLYPKSV